MLGGAREWKRVKVEGVSGIRSLCEMRRVSMSAGEEERERESVCDEALSECVNFPEVTRINESIHVVLFCLRCVRVQNHRTLHEQRQNKRKKERKKEKK